MWTKDVTIAPWATLADQSWAIKILGQCTLDNQDIQNVAHITSVKHLYLRRSLSMKIQGEGRAHAPQWMKYWIEVLLGRAMQEDQQTSDTKTRIGMMIGTTAEETHIVGNIVKTMMNIMTPRSEARGMLTTATLMSLWQSVHQTDDPRTVVRTMKLLH